MDAAAAPHCSNRSSDAGSLPLSYPWLRLARLLPAVLLLGVLGASPVVTSSSVPAARFVFLTDFHADPFYGRSGAYSCNRVGAYPPLGWYGCDSPWALVNSTVSGAAAVVPQPSFVVMCGDLVRHGASLLPKEPPEDTVVGVIRGVAEVVAQAFPSLAWNSSGNGSGSGLVWVLGNNDLLGDYYLDLSPSSSFLRDVASSLSDVLSPEEQATVATGGYYSREMGPGLNLTVAVLNTIPYSPRHNPNTTTLDDPLGQFQWLQGILQAARQKARPVYIFGHIPPVQDTYSFRTMWVDKYITSYVSIVGQYRDVVAGQFFGHLHVEEFHTFPPELSMPTPILVGSAISPLFLNSPSFRIVDFDPGTAQVLDYSTYYTLLSNTSDTFPQHWSLLYSARANFSLSNLSSNSFRNLAKALALQPALFATFMQVYRPGYVGSLDPCDGVCRWKYMCALTELHQSGFQSCLLSYPSVPTLLSVLGLTTV
eukprot:RCo012825